MSELNITTGQPCPNCITLLKALQQAIPMAMGCPDDLAEVDCVHDGTCRNCWEFVLTGKTGVLFDENGEAIDLG